MEPQLIGTIAALIAIIGGVYAAFKWGKGLLSKLWRFILRYKPRVPRETVRVLPQVYGCFWSEASVSGKPAMQVVGQWHVTNITGDPVLLLRTRIAKPETDGQTFTRHPERGTFGQYPILPGQTTEVDSNFVIIPPIRKVGEDLKVTLFLTDQYGNDHKIRNVVFKGPSPKQPASKRPAPESIHSISDPIEKEVVAVLKAEVNRYKDCGRRVGGLGSIETIIRGHANKGIGTEWREADSPKNQSIVEDESEVTITSDNAQALLNLHASLSDEQQRQLYYDALLKRIAKGTEYSSIGYLPLYVLFRLEKLNEALDIAKAQLVGDEAYGFSEFLQFLDGLLRFRHSSFSPEMLDHVERFIDGLNEYTFRIPERLAAIRAYRLATGKR